MGDIFQSSAGEFKRQLASSFDLPAGSPGPSAARVDEKTPGGAQIREDPAVMEDPPEPKRDTPPATCAACLSRRAVLRGGAVGALVAALPLGCMPSNMPPAGPVAAGNVADVRVGSLQAVGSENVLLGRDLGGLYAMTRVCTHLGQLVSVITVGSTTLLHCYGHGSEFSMNGAVTIGPATRPLEHFQVDLGDDGNITIQADKLVTPDARTRVD
jgi:nitrite reductase/ring-hydroxylating ferredoxin subunit